MIKPAMAMVWPLPSSTVDCALRLVRDGMTWVTPPPSTLSSPVSRVRALLLESSLTETFRLRLIRPESSTTGRNLTPTPNSL
ncbi:hypothetical protein D3C81_1850570 [compost metagenome]